MTVMIRLENIKKSYQIGKRDLEVLRGVNLHVDEGELVAIMGPSGSGKSTLMHIIGCLDYPTGGKYFLSGQDVSKLNDNQLALFRNQKIGFVFQSFNLLARTSALENVELPLLYSDVPAEVRLRRSRASLATVGLAHREQSHPNQLSGGQQQRVAIARSLVNRPALLLADEPSSDLDEETEAEIMHLFEEIHRKKGVTIILITHNLSLAGKAQRKLRMSKGRLVDI